MKSSSRSVAMLARPLVNRIGKMRPSWTASCSAADKCSTGMVPLSKYSSISSSLPSATSSTSASWRDLASAVRLAGISLVTLPRPSPPEV